MCGTKPIDEKAEKMGWYDLIKTVHHAFEYGLHCNDMNHKDVEHEISSAIDKLAKQNDLPVHDWKTPYEEQYGPKEETMIDLHDWNDVANTTIPLNEEIFALLEDRQNPEKLRPAVIVAKMMPAKRLTWTENKEGDVLCYDVPAGNFHSCNGAQIKYWKPVNIPTKVESLVCGVVEAPKDCFDYKPLNPQQNPRAIKGFWKHIALEFVPDKYRVDWQCSCGTVNSFSRTEQEFLNFPDFSVYCTQCGRRVDFNFDKSKNPPFNQKLNTSKE